MRVVGSSHYYFGTSISKLFLHKLILLIGFLRTQSPRGGILTSTLQVKNSKIGKTALILGTGPSLDRLNTDEVPLYVDDVFAMNEFFTLRISERVKPNFYCLSDPAHFVVTSEYSEDRRQKLGSYLEDLNATLILPHWSANNVRFHGSQKLHFDDRELSWFRKNISPVKPRAYSSATLYKALAMACYMGYDTIFLLGLDNSNFKSYQGSVTNLTIDTLAHTAETFENTDLNMTGAPQIKFSSGMAGRMQSFSRLFGDLALFPKDRIINLSSESLVDVFNKIECHPLVR